MVKRGLILGGVLAIISLASFSYVYADTTGSTKFSVDIENTVLELTIPASPAVIDLNPTMTGASFGSTNVTVKVATNNITGYQLTMTPTNSQTNTSLIRTELVGSESTYREIETLDLTDPVSTGYPEADFTANKWGYKITGNNYYGIDPNNTTVSHPAWITNEPTNGTNHNLTLAAKVDAETVSGSYETTLNFRAVTNAVVAKDTITFNGNGADSGDMSSDTVVAPYGTSIILPANKYNKSGYRFIGWNTNTSGTGLSYVDEGEYNPVSSDYSHNITLYAMWSNLPEGASTSGTTPSGNPGVTISRAYEIAYTAAGKGMWEETAEGSGVYTQITDGVYHNRDVRWDMQGMTPEICGSVTVLDDSYLAIDVRDFHKYNIAKLKDGRCWLQDNLALDPTDTTTAARMKGNTNAPDNAIDNYLHGGNSGGMAGWSSIAVYNAPPENIFDSYDKPMIDNTQKDTISSDSMDQAGRWKAGIYYNYCAASSGTYCYGAGQGPDLPDTNIDSSYDLCPTNWRMPVGGNIDRNASELYAVFHKYLIENDTLATNHQMRSALHISMSGYHGYWGNIAQLGSENLLWTCTFSNTNAWGSMMGNARTNTGYSILSESSGHRMNSASVRCIAK